LARLYETVKQYNPATGPETVKNPARFHAQFEQPISKAFGEPVLEPDGRLPPKNRFVLGPGREHRPEAPR
jgi:hypothetical protein